MKGCISDFFLCSALLVLIGCSDRQIHDNSGEPSINYLISDFRGQVMLHYNDQHFRVLDGSVDTIDNSISGTTILSDTYHDHDKSKMIDGVEVLVRNASRSVDELHLFFTTISIIDDTVFSAEVSDLYRMEFCTSGTTSSSGSEIEMGGEAGILFFLDHIFRGDQE